MKCIKKSSENEMIAVFLQAEINSQRFGDVVLKELVSLNLDRSLIDNPDLINDQDNAHRKNILANYRGYGRNALLFNNFPKNVEWKWMRFSQSDLEKVKYIAYDYWEVLSGGSRLPKDAARNLQKGMVVFNESNQRFFDALESLKNGAVFPPMIFVSTSESQDLVALEGHLRLTVYMLEPELIPHHIDVIVGYSPDFESWDLF